MRPKQLGRKTKRPAHYDKHKRDKEAYKFYHSPEWLQFREWYALNFAAGIKRPDGKINARCQKCGEWRQSWILHHRQELRDAPELALEPSNMLLWCVSCHSKEHWRREHGANQRSVEQ